MARTYIATPLWNMSKTHYSKMKRIGLIDVDGAKTFTITKNIQRIKFNF